MFYEAFANSYDEMINWTSRLETERDGLKEILSRFDIKTLVDAGSGTGIHSITLSKLGYKVVAMDNNPKMMEVAQANAKRHKVKNVEWKQLGFKDIDKAVDKPVDAILCLGNSLPHLVDDEEIIEVLGLFYDNIKPGGIFLLQMVHFDHYLDSADSAVAVTEGEWEGQDVIFRRHYEFKGTKVIFHVSVYDAGRRELLKTWNAPLNAIRKDLLISFMEKTGFIEIETSVDFQGTPIKSTDRSLVILARKPTEEEAEEIAETAQKKKKK